MLAPSSLNLAPAWQRAAFWVNCYGWFGAELWVWLRERRLNRGQRQDGGSLWWVVLWVSAGVWLGFAAMYNASFSAIQHATAAWFVAGIAITWVGEAFRLWAVRTLGSYFRVRVEIQAGHQIVQHGPEFATVIWPQSLR
ncbi:MAG: isoprenylcysteine carboxylmethyltransferase family protein [Terriglobales bacterium]